METLLVMSVSNCHARMACIIVLCQFRRPCAGTKCPVWLALQLQDGCERWPATEMTELSDFDKRTTRHDTVLHAARHAGAVQRSRSSASRGVCKGPRFRL